ncbi:MAG TPA: Na-translocating system protein MpsC family protein [Solirubrobacterales bacterium]|nr:Na-translocating system protein MpsC family protein [Solirubrobacterales bacterium]
MATTGEKSTPRTLNRDISRAMVALFKEAMGRGPGRARTYIEDGVVLTVLHDTMTKAEHTLKDENLEDHVRDLRRIFQGTFREEAIAVVERLTGRKVLAFLSDHAVDPDYAVEVFILEPGPEVEPTD